MSCCGVLQMECTTSTAVIRHAVKGVSAHAPCRQRGTQGDMFIVCFVGMKNTGEFSWQKEEVVSHACL